MSNQRDPVQTHLLIQCLGQYADRQCVENIGLRIEWRNMREIYDLAKRYKETSEWTDLEAAKGADVKEARKLVSEARAGLFIAIDLLAGTTLQNPRTPDALLAGRAAGAGVGLEPPTTEKQYNDPS